MSAAPHSCLSRVCLQGAGEIGGALSTYFSVAKRISLYLARISSQQTIDHLVYELTQRMLEDDLDDISQEPRPPLLPDDPVPGPLLEFSALPPAPPLDHSPTGPPLPTHMSPLRGSRTSIDFSRWGRHGQCQGFCVALSHLLTTPPPPSRVFEFKPSWTCRTCRPAVLASPFRKQSQSTTASSAWLRCPAWVGPAPSFRSPADLPVLQARRAGQLRPPGQRGGCKPPVQQQHAQPEWERARAPRAQPVPRQRGPVCGHARLLRGGHQSQHARQPPPQAQRR
jgi:hypothetical protein